MFAAAVRFLHMKLLQDLAPPWVTHPFLQALPGDGVLCRYTKPTFLRWDIARADCLFGDAVMATWRWVARAVDAGVAGVLAMPLYACTQTRADGGTCMALAAMSPLLEQRAAHKHFACARCQGEAGSAPASGSAPRRVLRLYVLVHTVAGRSTVLRTSPLHVLVDAPLDDVQWGLGFAGNSLDVPRRATPTKATRVEGKRKGQRILYTFNAEESNVIWAEARNYMQEADVPPLLC